MGEAALLEREGEEWETAALLEREGGSEREGGRTDADGDGCGREGGKGRGGTGAGAGADEGRRVGVREAERR
jgi:hypothetical protein